MTTLKLLRLGLVFFKFWHAQLKKDKLMHLCDLDVKEIEQNFKDKIKEIQKAELINTRKN